MDNNLINVNLELLNKDTSKMTRQEKLQYLKDLEFERLAFKNHWSDEERIEKRIEFDKEEARKDKLHSDSVKILLGNDDKLTSLEKKQAEKYIEENPEIPAIFSGVVNMVCEGATDVENVMDYSDI